MAKSEAARDVKFGFFVAIGFVLFFIVASIILSMSLYALGKSS